MLLPYPLFAIPSLPLSYIPRNILCPNWLQRNRTQIVILEAGGGYGKTTILVEYLHAVSSQVIWYPLEHLQRPDLVTFVQNLLRAAQMIDPGLTLHFDPYLAELLKANDATAIEQAFYVWLLPTLLRQIIDWEKPISLVIENYHIVDDPKIDEFLLRLIEDSPPNLRIFVTSRRRIDWPFRVEWEAIGRMLTVDQSRMMLSWDDAQRIAFTVNRQMPTETMRALYEAAQGWMLVFTLACREQSSTNSMQHAFLSISIHEQAERYLQELFSAEQPDRQAFLMRTAILDDLSAAHCDSLLQSCDSSQMLNQLDKGIFLRIQSTQYGLHYRHSHNIIQSFLRTRLLQQIAPLEIGALYTRLGLLHEAAGEWSQALNAYVKAENSRAAEALIEGRLFYLLDTVQFRLLEQWLAQLPATWLTQSNGLMLCQAILLTHQENPRAEFLLQRVIELCQQQQDGNRYALATAELSFLLHNKIEYAQGYQLLETQPLDNFEPRLHAHLLHRRALAKIGIDDFLGAQIDLERALSIRRYLNTIEDEYVMNSLLRLLAIVQEYLGFPLRSIQILKDACNLVRTLPNHQFMLAWTLNNLAAQYRTSAEFASAERVLTEASEYVENYRQITPNHRLFIYIELNRIHLRCDVYDNEAIEAWIRRLQNAGELNFKGTIWHEGLYDYYFSHTALHATGLALAQKSWQSAQQTNSPYVHCNVIGTLALAFLVNENPQRAQSLFQEALNVWKRHAPGITCLSQIYVMVYLGETFFRLGQPDKGLAIIQSSFSLMNQRGIYNLEVWVPQIMAHLCYQALVHEIEPEFVEALVRKRFRTRYGEPFRQLLLDPRPQVRRRGERILQQMSDQNLQKAYDLLQGCKIDSTQQRLLSWLVDGWLTPYGLLYLEQLLGWREIEVFLCWIRPALQAELDTIARLIGVRPGTCNGYLKEVKEKLRQASGLQLDGRGANAVALDWAVKQRVIDPLK